MYNICIRLKMRMIQYLLFEVLHTVFPMSNLK